MESYYDSKVITASVISGEICFLGLGHVLNGRLVSCLFMRVLGPLLYIEKIHHIVSSSTVNTLFKDIVVMKSCFKRT